MSQIRSPCINYIFFYISTFFGLSLDNKIKPANLAKLSINFITICFSVGMLGNFICSNKLTRQHICLIKHKNYENNKKIMKIIKKYISLHSKEFFFSNYMSELQFARLNLIWKMYFAEPL